MFTITAGTQNLSFSLKCPAVGDWLKRRMCLAGTVKMLVVKVSPIYVSSECLDVPAFNHAHYGCASLSMCRNKCAFIRGNSLACFCVVWKLFLRKLHAFMSLSLCNVTEFWPLTIPTVSILLCDLQSAHKQASFCPTFLQLFPEDEKQCQR